MPRRRPLLPTSLLPHDFLNEMNQFVRRVEDAVSGGTSPGAGPRSERAPGTWVPRAEIHQTLDALIVGLELPGVAKTDVDVETTEEGLSVRAERPVPEGECAPDGHCSSEFHYGTFQRFIAWPAPVSHAAATATMDGGVLTVKAPLAEEAKAPQPTKLTVD